MYTNMQSLYMKKIKEIKKRTFTYRLLSSDQTRPCICATYLKKKKKVNCTATVVKKDNPNEYAIYKIKIH